MSQADITDVSFTFKNIGPIQDAKLRLGDLTIIAGRNNTGKTYLAYTLYGFLKVCSELISKSHIELAYFDKSVSKSLRTFWIKVIDDYQEMKFGDIDTSVDESGAASEQVARGSFREDWLDRVRKEAAEAMVLHFNGKEFPRVFGSRLAVSDGAMHLELDKGIASAHDLSIGDRQSLERDATVTYEAGRFVISSDVPELLQYEVLPQEVRQVVVTQMMFNQLSGSYLLPELSVEPVVLSAERFGISLFYREIDSSRSQVLRELQTGTDTEGMSAAELRQLLDRSTSRYALAVHDNISYTRNIPNVVSNKGELLSSRLFDDIRDMMGGRFVSEGDGTLFVGTSHPGRFRIPLHHASSSARGLADLYFYIRHLSRRGQLLIIDEPESHLDTRNQLLMARLLTRLVKAGVRVLVTTHSDYIVKELNNLIMLHSNFPDKDVFLDEFGYDANDGIAPDMVKAYIASDSSIQECEIDECGATMPVFDDTIRELNNASNSLAIAIGETAGSIDE